MFDGPGGSKGNLNLLYHRLYFDYLETGTRTPLGSAARDRKVTEDQHGDSYEIGGDYEFGLGIGKLKLIGLSRGNAYPDTTTVVTRFGNAATPIVGDRFTQDGKERETHRPRRVPLEQPRRGVADLGRGRVQQPR